MLVDVLNEALVHEQGMRTARSIGVDCHGEYELVVLPVEIVEMVSPNVFEVPALKLGYRPKRPGQPATYLGLTHPCEFGEFFMNVNGGRSSMCQLPGISTRPVVRPGIKGFIQVSAFLE